MRGGERVDIEPGVWHDWWNEGQQDAIVRVEVTPGQRFVHLIETLLGLGVIRDGEVQDEPCAVLRRYEDPSYNFPTPITIP